MLINALLPEQTDNYYITLHYYYTSLNTTAGNIECHWFPKNMKNYTVQSKYIYMKTNVNTDT